MLTDRKRLILDHLHGLLTLQQVADRLGVSIQRAYQLKQQLWQDYHIPVPYQRNGPAAARWVAAQDARNRVFRYTPAFFYNNERWQDYREW